MSKFVIMPYCFIDGLKKEQSLNELKLEQFTAGQSAAEGKKKYRDTSERIKSIVEEYEIDQTLTTCEVLCII